MALLAMVEKESSGTFKVLRSAGKSDLMSFHPQCQTCGKIKGIHGQEGQTMVFCQWANKPVEKSGYCSNHTELTPDEV